MMKQLTALLGLTLLLVGCAGVGLQEAGLPGASWQRVAYQEDEGDDATEELEETLEDAYSQGGLGAVLTVVGTIIGLSLLMEDDDEEESLGYAEALIPEHLKHEPPRWQRNLEDAAGARISLWQPAPYPAAAAERWRCEVGWRCYATDPDTRERTELLRSGTAWYEDEATQTSGSTFVCAAAKDEARDVSRCRQGIPHYEELEIDRDCSCRRL